MRLPLLTCLVACLSSSFLAPVPAQGVEPSTFAAVHPIGRTSWVELARFDEEPPAGGRGATLSDDFFHASRRAIPGARPLGTPVRLYGATGTCDGTLGRPALLGLYYGDEGFGGGPAWMRAAPVRGCAGGSFSVAVLSARPEATRARDVTEERDAPSALALAQARVALTTSHDWLAARSAWAENYASTPVVVSDRAFALGDAVWALADEGISAECGTQLSARTFVRRAADGTTTRVPFPGSDSETLDLFGDLDGDGQAEAVLGGGPGDGVRVVRLGLDGRADELWRSDGIPFFACPC